MNCHDVQAYVSDAIDRSLPRQLADALRAHLDLCHRCRNEYELQKLSKTIVQQRLKRLRTPPDISTLVVESLRDEYSSLEDEPQSRGAHAFIRRILPPTLAVSAAAVAFVLFFAQPPPTLENDTVHTAANDIINQSYTYFSSIRSGELRPKMISCFPEGLLAYFHENNVNFAVNVVPVEGCDWYGAVTSEYSGVKLAHVMYKIGEETLYVYQVSQQEALEGKRLSLPPAARAALAQSGWYTDPEHPECNVVLWTAQGTLCAAVSTMNKEKVLALLTPR